MEEKKKIKKIYFEESKEDCSVKSLLSDLKFRNNKFHYSTIPPFLQEHKEDLVFLFKSFEKSKITLKLSAFTMLALENVNKKNSYTIGQSGYGLNHKNNMDILVTSNEMIKLSVILEKYGYSFKENHYVWFDYEDYILFTNIQLHGKKLGEDQYKGKYAIKGKTFISPEIYVDEFNLDNKLESYRKVNIKRENRYELMMKNILNELDIKYEYQKIVVTDGCPYILDFFIPSKYICIEVDGEYHHEESQMSKDIKRSNFLAKKGILTVRYDNDYIEYNKNRVKDEIKALIK